MIFKTMKTFLQTTQIKNLLLGMMIGAGIFISLNNLFAGV